MADGQMGLSPLQQFIQQSMETQAFIEQQRQAGFQEALAQRQIENQEIEMFTGMMKQIPDPGQRTAALDLFIQRNPDAATTFEAIASAVPASVETLLAGAAGTVTPEQLQNAVLNQFGLRLTEEEAQNLAQRRSEQLQEQTQFEATMGQRQLEFEETMGLSQDELELRRRLGFGDLALRGELGRRGLDIEEMQTLNQRELGLLGVNVQAGTFPELMRAEQSRAIAALRERIDTAGTGARLMHPARRMAIEQEIADRTSTMGRMDELWRANIARLVGSEGASEFGGMTLAQLVSAAEVAHRQVDEASDPGMKEAAAARLTQINTMLNMTRLFGVQPQLEFNPPMIPWMGFSGSVKVVRP